jgi:hypothetical protein
VAILIGRPASPDIWVLESAMFDGHRNQDWDEVTRCI